MRRRVSPSRTNTSVCAFAPREYVFSCAVSQPFRTFSFFFFSRRTFPLARPPSPLLWRPVRIQVHCGCDFFLLGPFWLLFPSSEVTYSSGHPLASEVFSRPTTRLLLQPLSGPQSLPSDSDLHQRRFVVLSGSHIYVQSRFTKSFVHHHHRLSSALTARTVY